MIASTTEFAVDEYDLDIDIEDFEETEESEIIHCPRCGGNPGCNYCLMTGW